MVTIYAVCDARTTELKYIGATACSLSKRLGDHRRAKQGVPQGSLWIQEQHRQGVPPDVLVLDLVEDNERVEAERFWIAYFRFIGANLLNQTSGGEGAKGITFTYEYKQNMSKVTKGKTFTAEHLAKIKKSLKGRIFKEEQRRKISETKKKIGDTHSKEYLQLMKELYKGEKNPNCLLKEHEVLDIYHSKMQGVKTSILAAKYKVSVDTIRSIEKGRNWNYLTGARSALSNNLATAEGVKR